MRKGSSSPRRGPVSPRNPPAPSRQKRVTAGAGASSPSRRGATDGGPSAAPSDAVSIRVIHLAQDDPRKNTALRLAKHGLVEIADHPRRGGILLDPEARVAVSRADHDTLAARGLAAVDCSWERIHEATKGHRRGMERRALPFLVAANPVKFGQPFTLSTAEALAAALTIAGFEAQARKLLSVLPWGERFFEVNREPLSDYAACETSAEVVEAQKAFV